MNLQRINVNSRVSEIHIDELKTGTLIVVKREGIYHGSMMQSKYDKKYNCISEHNKESFEDKDNAISWFAGECEFYVLK